MDDSIDWSDIESVARQLAGNHRHFEGLTRFEPPADSDDWMLLYTHSRESGLLEISNAYAIAKELEQSIGSNTVVPVRHAHCLVGWIEGFFVRVFDADGQPTGAFHVYCGLMERLARSPVLDEADFVARQYRSAVRAIEQQGSGLVFDGAPGDWPDQVVAWLFEHNPLELACRGEHGARPSFDAIEEALYELGFLPDDSPEEGDFTTEDFVNWFQRGQLLLTTPFPADWRALLVAQMDAQGYWPDVWFISDHGIPHRINLND
jgi:hypothetical protein